MRGRELANDASTAEADVSSSEGMVPRRQRMVTENKPPLIPGPRPRFDKMGHSVYHYIVLESRAVHQTSVTYCTSPA